MKCDNPGCKNEGHVIQKYGVICYECNDRDIEFMESKQFRRSQDEYENFISASRERLLEKGLQDAKEGKLVTNSDFPSLEGITIKPYKNQTAEEFFLGNQHDLVLKTPKLTLPTDSAERKKYPLFRGCIKYFTAALAGVARISSIGNEKHNPGEEMYHARGKSSDHGDCIIRHLMDTEDLIAAKARGYEVSDQQILDESAQMAWRSLAYCQELHERFGKAPMASGAK